MDPRSGRSEAWIHSLKGGNGLQGCGQQRDHAAEPSSSPAIHPARGGLQPPTRPSRTAFGLSARRRPKQYCEEERRRDGYVASSWLWT
jgi:hypothetical protein